MASLETFFDMLREGIRTNDDHAMDLAANGILGIIRTPYLMNLEKFREACGEDDFQVDL